MFERQHGKILFECDDCAEVLETGTDDFAEAVKILKRDEWLAKLFADTWVHRCPVCK